MKIKNFRMNEFSGCAAPNRPSYCKYETNMCCFGCDYNDVCTGYARAKGIKMIPCTENVFEEHEVCNFAL